MASNRRLITALVTLAALTAAACGSTVPLEEQEVAEAAAAQGVADGGLTVDANGNPIAGSGGVGSGSGSFVGSGGGSGSGSLVSSGGTSGGAAGSGSVAAGGSAVTPGENGPGVSAHEIKVGFAFPTDGQEANTALGGAGATQIDYRRAYETMVGYVNAHGAVGNRKLAPVYHGLHVASSESKDQQDQEMCAHFTEDDPVFMSEAGFKTENGTACLEQAGNVVVTANALLSESNAFFEKYPHFIEHDGIDNDDVSILYVDSLAKLKYFKDAKVGIITWDHPYYAAPVQQTLIPRLKKYGVTPENVQFVKWADNYDDYPEVASQVGNAAVQFKAADITHVMFLDANALLAFFFMQAAQRQQYHPRYGLNTGSGFTALAGLLRSGGDSDAREQLHGSIGVGWLPTIDVSPDDFPSWAKPASQKLCYSILQKGGVTMDSANARAQGEGVCNTVWTMQATLKAAGPVLNQDTFLRGLDRVGLDDVQPTSGMGFAVSSTRHDGNAYAATLKFYDQCVCFRYTSDRFDVPSN